MADKHRVEKAYGRSLSDEQWLGVGPDDDRQALEGLRPRIEERELELAAVVSGREASQAVARDPSVLRPALATRRSVFGSEAPPFQTADAAKAWLEKESAEYMGEEHTSVIRWPPDPHVREALKELRNRKGWRAEGSDATQAGVEVLGMHLEAYGRIPKTRVGDSSIPARGPRLTALAEGIEAVCEVSHCWSLGEASIYVMTGQVPELPPIRLWRDTLPGGARRALIELYAPLQFKDLRAIVRAHRDHFGVTGKWSVSPDDLELVGLVEERMPPASRWEDIRTVWNEERPDRTFKTASGIWKAYSRAKDRIRPTQKVSPEDT